MERRFFLRAAGRVGFVALSAGGFAGCNSGVRDPTPLEAYLDETEQWRDNVPRSGNVVDMTNATRPVISVGAGPNNHQFRPLAMNVSAGTTVMWVWTGKGGKHNVQFGGEVPFNSGPPQRTGKFTHTFTEQGVNLYRSVPDESEKMRGAIGVIPNASDRPNTLTETTGEQRTMIE